LGESGTRNDTRLSRRPVSNWLADEPAISWCPTIASPAAFQYSAVASSAMALNAPPMPIARGPTGTWLLGVASTARGAPAPASRATRAARPQAERRIAAPRPGAAALPR